MAKRGQGEGSISKREDGTWWARITVGRTPDGKQKRKAFYGKTRAEVQKKMTAALAEINTTGGFIDESRMTFGHWLDIWLNEYKKHEIKPTTYVNYRVRVENHIKPSIGHYKLKDLRVDTIQTMINGLNAKGLSSSTVGGAFKTMFGALEQAVDNGLLHKNVAAKVTLPTIQKKSIRVFTLEEQARFVGAAKDTYMGEVFLLDLGTGLRIGEILGLVWGDINFDDELLRVNRTINITKDYDDTEAKWKKSFGSPKTKASNRSVPLLPSIVTLLNEVKRRQDEQRLQVGSAYEDIGLVFATQLGRPLDPRNMQRTFASIIKKAGIEQGVHIHCLRHTFATRGLESGVELKVMQELLGHSSIKMTADLYTHVLPDKKKSSMMRMSSTLSF